MTVPLAELEHVLARLGVVEETPEAEHVERLLTAVSDEVRRLTRRALEGAPTVYRERITRWQRDTIVRLAQVPVTDVLSVRGLAWDGTPDLLDPTDVPGGAATTLAASTAPGATNLKVVSVDGIAAGVHLRVGAGVLREVVRVTDVGTAGSEGTGLTIEPALQGLQAAGAAVVAVAGSAGWRLLSSELGRIELRRPLRDLEVVYRVSGVVPPSISEAVEDWVEARWTTPVQRRAGILRYKTGQDEETYDTVRVGTPPRDVARALTLVGRYAGGPV